MPLNITVTEPIYVEGPNTPPFFDRAPSSMSFVVIRTNPQLEFNIFLSQALDEKDQLSAMVVSSKSFGEMSYAFINSKASLMSKSSEYFSYDIVKTNPVVTFGSIELLE